MTKKTYVLNHLKKTDKNTYMYTFVCQESKPNVNKFSS